MELRTSPVPLDVRTFVGRSGTQYTRTKSLTAVFTSSLKSKPSKPHSIAAHKAIPTVRPNTTRASFGPNFYSAPSRA